MKFVWFLFEFHQYALYIPRKWRAQQLLDSRTHKFLSNRMNVTTTAEPKWNWTRKKTVDRNNGNVLVRPHVSCSFSFISQTLSPRRAFARHTNWHDYCCSFSITPSLVRSSSSFTILSQRNSLLVLRFRLRSNCIRAKEWATIQINVVVLWSLFSVSSQFALGTDRSSNNLWSVDGVLLYFVWFVLRSLCARRCRIDTHSRWPPHRLLLFRGCAIGSSIEAVDCAFIWIVNTLDIRLDYSEMKRMRL